MAADLGHMPLEVGRLIFAMASEPPLRSYLALSENDPILYRRIHIDIRNASAFLESMKSRQSRDSTFFESTVKTLYMDSTSRGDERAEPQNAIKVILATCTGLTTFGCDSVDEDAFRRPADRTRHPLEVDYAARQNLNNLLNPRIDINVGALPTSLTRLRCKSGQIALCRKTGGFFARLPRLPHIYVNCRLTADGHVLSLLKDPLPETVKLCVYEIQFVSCDPKEMTYVELNQVLRKLKDPRVIVLAHPTFGFPSLPNLVRYKSHDSKGHRRKQLEHWAEAEQFAWRHVQARTKVKTGAV